MNGLKPIPLHYAREIRDLTGAKRVLIMAIDGDGTYQMATWAHTEEDGEDAATFIGSEEASMAAAAFAAAKRKEEQR